VGEGSLAGGERGQKKRSAKVWLSLRRLEKNRKSAYANIEEERKKRLGMEGTNEELMSGKKKKKGRQTQKDSKFGGEKAENKNQS